MDALEGSTALVVGGAGFIGSHVVDELLRTPVRRVVVLDNLIRGSRENLVAALEDERVELVEGSILDRTLLAELARDSDSIFHLAALWLYECVHEPRKALEVNVEGTFNVLEAALEGGVKKVVFSSSASVYGDGLYDPIDEEHPFNNRTTYGATKIAGEQLFRAAREQHGLDYVALRYMNAYGPRMDYSGTYTSVIMKVLDRIAEGERPLVFGDGSQAYDFVHVRDVARSNVLALLSEATDDAFNVGTGVKTTINELVQLLLQITGSELEPEYLPQEEFFVTNRVGSTEKAERLLGFRSETSLEDGLRSVVDWRRSDEQATLARIE
jgi:UDP-glucose 4-epimerase